MTKNETAIVRKAYEDTIWMAIRYAHGRHTYAPYMVRDAVKNFKEVFPDFELKEDKTIAIPKYEEFGIANLESDYLHDLFKKV